MNLIALQTFLAIVETGSLVRASERLNVTQSTVTARLKSLEDEIGQTLLIRQKSGATLTASGQRLIRYAEVMTELWRQAKQETSLPKGIDSVVNIGCHPDLWLHLGHRFFEIIRETQPRIAISAWPARSQELATWLNSGLIDVALTYQPNARGSQTLYTLPEERLVLVSTRPDSPIRFDPKYVFVEAGGEFGRRHAATYADAAVADISFGAAEWGLQHLLDHGGSAYLPYRIARPYLDNKTFFLLEEAPEFKRRAYLVVNDAAAAGWDWLPETIQKIAETDQP